MLVAFTPKVVVVLVCNFFLQGILKTFQESSGSGVQLFFKLRFKLVLLLIRTLSEVLLSAAAYSY